MKTDRFAEIRDTKKYDTILLFQEPERYFFPQMKGIVYAPLRIRNVRLRFWLYLTVYRFPFLCVPALIGPWKNKIRMARQVILFDFGYIPGIEHYIRRINPACRVYLFYWNMITKSSRSYQIFSDPDNIYSTDQRDCRKYGLRYHHIFYFCIDEKMHKKSRSSEYTNHLFFFGLDKGRGPQLLRLKRYWKPEGCAVIFLFSANLIIESIGLRLRRFWKSGCFLIRNTAAGWKNAEFCWI